MSPQTMSAPCSAGGVEHAVADGVGADHEHRADGVCRIRDLPQLRLDGAGAARGLDPDGGDVVTQSRGQPRDIRDAVDRVDELEVEVHAHEVAHLRELRRQHVARDEDAAAAAHATRHRQRRRRRLVAVVGRHVDDVHGEQLGHERLVLEQGLEATVVLVGFAGVRGEELAAPDDLVDDGGHVVVVGAGAEEAQALPRRDVLREEALDVAHEILLGRERRRQVERPVEPQFGGHVGVELVDGCRADGGEHRRLRIRRGVRDVRVDEWIGHWCLSRWCRTG